MKHHWELRYITSTEVWKNKLQAMKCFLWEVAATNITSSFHLMHSGEISRREKQILFFFFRKWLKGLWDKISLCSSKCWERYLLIMFHSYHCALPLMECLPLAFQRQQPIKATDDSRWCVVRSFDSFCLFESDIFIPSPRIWGLFVFFCNASCKNFQPCFYLLLHFNRKWQ